MPENDNILEMLLKPQKHVFIVVVHSIYRGEGIDDCSTSGVFETLESAKDSMFYSLLNALTSLNSEYSEEDYGDTIDEVLKFVKDKELYIDIDVSDTMVVVDGGGGDKITISIQEDILEA